MAIGQAPALPGSPHCCGPGHPRLQPEAVAFRGWLNPLGMPNLGCCRLLPPLTSLGIPCPEPKKGLPGGGSPGWTPSEHVQTARVPSRTPMLPHDSATLGELPAKDTTQPALKEPLF